MMPVTGFEALRELVRATERFLLPNACISCDALVSVREPDALVCGVCLSRMRAVGSGCSRCAQPLPPVGPCRFCAEWTERIHEVRSAVWLGPESRSLVHRLKYGHARRLGNLAGQIVADRVAFPGRCVLVPIPVSHRRLRERGYNQAEIIARELSRRWRLPLWSGLVRRTSQATSQTTLTPMARAANVSDAFSAEPPRGRQAHDGRVVIVDDVLTTGATIDACARALADAGWDNIQAVTFARAMPYEFHAGGY